MRNLNKKLGSAETTLAPTVSGDYCGKGAGNHGRTNVASLVFALASFAFSCDPIMGNGERQKKRLQHRHGWGVR